MKKIINKAFTLVELLIVIALISIIFLAMSSLDFNSLSDKQKAEIFTNKVVSQIEDARNNALMGKAIKNEIPKKWKVDIHSSTGGNNGIIKTSYLTGSSWGKFEELKVDGKIEKIQSLNCGGSKIGGTGTIIFEGANSSLSGSCKSNNYEMNIGIKRNTQNFTIKFDAVNSLVNSEYKK